MPLYINTNIPSITAQTNLQKSSDSLTVSLQRLGSGLRINSAKDDAAGLAISTRFVSRIQGATQAQRNANDAVSLAQLAEGALQESTNLLQRIRVLAVQSANATNGATDRQAMQSEVNQLTQEITRIGVSSQFNGVNILDGSYKNQNFQIGTEANQVVGITLSDCRATAIGSSNVVSNNQYGIETATGYNAYANLTGTALGSEVAVSSATANNGYAAQTYTITNYNASGTAITNTTASSANDTARTIATNITAAALAAVGAGTSSNNSNGIQAVGFNHVQVTSFSFANSDAAVSLYAGAVTQALLSGTGVNYTSATATTMATAINTNTNLSALGVYAVVNGSGLDVYSMGGDDLKFVNSSASGVNTLTIKSALRTDAAITYGSTTTATRGGRVDVYLPEGFTLAGSVSGAASADIFNTTAAAGPSQIGFTTNSIVGNAVQAQTLTVIGTNGTATVGIGANETASSVATAVNSLTASTNVTATASTVMQLDNLSTAGTITFNLFGDNTAAALVTAPVTNSSDLTPLLNAINAETGKTNITATFGTSNGQLLLTHGTGADIKLTNYTNSSAVDYPNVITTPLAGGTAPTSVATSLRVTGNPATNSSGVSTTLYSGGLQDGMNSSVVGGHVVFASTGAFTIASNIDGSHASSGSLFGSVAAAAAASTTSEVNAIDISTYAGAQSAITVVDAAIDQINGNRASLGAIQNRFSSAVNSLGSEIVNLSAANSRVQDADFAAETANLSRAQILQQAGMSVLAQANSLSQGVLSLLQ